METEEEKQALFGKFFTGDVSDGNEVLRREQKKENKHQNGSIKKEFW